MNKAIPVICGSRDLGGKKLVWALSLMDMRVYIKEEDTNIETLSLELDDFLGYEPAGFTWDFKIVEGSSKRVSAWVARTQALINKQKESKNE